MIQNKILEIDNSLTRVFYFFMCSSGLEKHLQSRQADVKMKHDQWLKTFRKIQRENRKGLDDMLSSLEAKMQEHAQKRKMAEFRQKKRQLNSAAIYIKRVAYPTLLSNQHPERPSVFYGGGNISADCIVDCAKEAIKAHEQQWNNFDDIMTSFEPTNSKVVAVSTGVNDQQASSSAATRPARQKEAAKTKAQKTENKTKTAAAKGKASAKSKGKAKAKKSKQ